MSMPANLPSVRDAALPKTYEHAKLALTECSRVDECKDWADKAAAMASYAKQSEDKSLFNMAVKIRARAIRRCGELLKALEASQGGRPKTGSHEGPSFRKQAASEAGLSVKQAKTAVRVANVDASEFESLVESDDPPTVTALATRGKKARKPDNSHLMGATPDEFYFGTHLFGALQRFVERTAEGTPTAAAKGERRRAKELRRNAATAIIWLERLVKAIDKDMRQCKQDKS